MNRTILAWSSVLTASVVCGCVHGEARPPKCGGAEEALATSDVYDHGNRPEDIEGKTWSCEAACPVGKTRVVVYRDNVPNNESFNFNGRLQVKYEYACIASCGEGERVEKRGVASGQGTRYLYHCYNVAEREARKEASEEAAAQKAHDGAVERRELDQAWRKIHPGAACLRDCADKGSKCVRAGRADCQAVLDDCTPECQGLAP